MVEDKDVLEDLEADPASDSDEDNPEGEGDQDSRSEPGEPKRSEESEEDENTGPRRSTRTRDPPERLNPNMTGQSYATEKMNVKVKRKMKKDIKLRTKKKFREEHYNLYTQGIRTETDCMEYTNLEGMILAMFMVKLNEMTDIGLNSFSEH